MLPSETKVNLHLEGTQEAVLSVDGFLNLTVEPGDWIEVDRSTLKDQFLRANPPNHYYATLTRRLGFSIRGQ